MKKNKIRVFCAECIHYYGPTCIAPDNLGTWHSRSASIRLPKEINAQNDCSWFEPNPREMNPDLEKDLAEIHWENRFRKEQEKLKADNPLLEIKDEEDQAD